MVIRLLAGAAATALLTLGAPATAATTPEAPAARSFAMFGDPTVSAFYASRGGAPLWFAEGPGSPAAEQLIGILKRSSVEGLYDGPGYAAQAEALIARANSGDRSALLEADRLLSTGWVKYIQLLHRPAAGMIYAERWVAPRSESAQDILKLAAAARSPERYLQTTASVNPIYAALRDAAAAAGSASDPRVIASLDRVRAFPARGRYVVVDTASARLWMVDDGRIADSMKVIVGKPTAQTPMIASAIHYATLNPYWNVPPDLVRTLIARNVLSQGPGYLKAHGYQLLSDFGDDPQLLSPADVDWKAVADGEANVRVRQLPGPGNSMGHLKFGFANNAGIYLHDTPKKELFASDDRDLSNGCIRLEDAERLGRWLLGRDPTTDSTAPEQHVLLPSPVPVYVTYLTAQANDGQLTFVDDVYNRDAGTMSTMASLR
ncbi:MAG TPA: L,D-transpeptidase family protein [Sphingomicrobium sp.]